MEKVLVRRSVLKICSDLNKRIYIIHAKCMVGCLLVPVRYHMLPYVIKCEEVIFPFVDIFYFFSTVP